ncbi:MAG TPA: tRNA lysidine(34) synthetase TilS, partial [Terriglobales bacterium]
RDHRLLSAGDRVGAAVSGGADSVALLRGLLALRDELGIVLSVVHVNHGLRAEAAADQRFVEELAASNSLQCHVVSCDVRALAAERRLSIEAAGRELRYRYFYRLISEGKLDKVATAHTRDDQAETVLLRMLRGAGTRGLAGVYRTVGDASEQGRIARPMLAISRAEVEAYLRGLGQPWREDESNRDPGYLRNRVRHELLPLLEREFNPNLRQILSETAEIAHEEEEFWAELAEQQLGKRLIRIDGESAARLDVRRLSDLPIALQRRVLRAFAERHSVRLDFEHLERMRLFALAGRAGKCELPKKVYAELRRIAGSQELRIVTPAASSSPGQNS